MTTDSRCLTRVDAKQRQQQPGTLLIAFHLLYPWMDCDCLVYSVSQQSVTTQFVSLSLLVGIISTDSGCTESMMSLGRKNGSRVKTTHTYNTLIHRWYTKTEATTLLVLIPVYNYFSQIDSKARPVWDPISKTNAIYEPVVVRSSIRGYPLFLPWITRATCVPNSSDIQQYIQTATIITIQ